MLETDRLILRPWQESDAEDLYNYAKDADIGTMADWSPHKSMEDSLQVIRTVFSAPETYAMELRESGKAIGCVGLLLEDGYLDTADDETEIGYWVGKPYWGQGLVPEAVKAVAAHTFNKLGKNRLWACCFTDNHRSQRVLEKCGFVFHHLRKASNHGERNLFFYVLHKQDFVNQSQSNESPLQNA